MGLEEFTGEQRYRELFEESPISLWEQDYSGVKEYLDQLRDEGVADIHAYLENNPDAFIKCARLVKVVDVNTRTLELYGAGSKQELYDNLGRTVPGEAHAFFLDQLAAIAEGSTVFEGETVNLNLRGERLHISVKWNLFPGVGYHRVLVALVDITERVAAEERLKERERLYRMLADNTQDLICMCDINFIRRYVSPSYKVVVGYEPEELLGVSIFSQVPPELKEEKEKEFVERVKDGFTDTVRQQILHRDGQLIWVDTKANILHDENGEAVGWLIVSRDVREQADAEEKLKESERLYRMLADNTQDLICMCDPEGNRVYVSPSYKAVLGYETEELMGGNILSIVHPDDLEETARGLARGLSEKMPDSTRHRLKHKDGHYVWFDSHGTPLSDENGELIGGLAVSWDISNKVSVEEALRESNEQLKGFLSVAAHELRHPINLVQGYVGTIQDFLDAPDPVLLDEIYSGIKHATGRLVRLVQELLEVSRIDQGRFFFELKEGDPVILAKEAAQELRMRGAGGETRIRVSGEPGNWVLDHDRFLQLMVILLENAINYSPADSPVEVELEKTGKGLEVSVLDRGRGVDVDVRECIFQRFYQVDEPKHHSIPGLGMGLFIAREIVEGHGGYIFHEDRPGGGSVFRFILPAADGGPAT